MLPRMHMSIHRNMLIVILGYAKKRFFMCVCVGETLIGTVYFQALTLGGRQAPQKERH